MLGLVIAKETMAVVSVGKDYESAVKRARSLELLEKGAYEYFAVKLFGHEARRVASILASKGDRSDMSIWLEISLDDDVVVWSHFDHEFLVAHAEGLKPLKRYCGEYCVVRLYDDEARTIAHVQENIDINTGIAANLAASEMED
jgi:hypothetical protein